MSSLLHRRPSIWLCYSLRPPGGVPRSFWRYILGLRIIVAGLLMVQAILLATYVFVCLRDGRFASPGLLISFAALSLSSAIVFYMGLSIGRRKYERVLAKHTYLICPHCGYVLVGLPPEYSCPECGTPYSHDHIRDAWLAWSAGSIIA